MRREAVFLDRDGTINEEVGYVTDISRFRFMPGVFEAISSLNRAGYLVVIVTNQSAVGRGFMSEDTLRQIHKWMVTQIESHGGKVDAVYYCPHTPQDKCNCRKPNPGLMEKAQRDFNIDLTKSFIIGDKESDIVLGRAIGCRTVLIRTTGVESNGGTLNLEPDRAEKSLLDAVTWITRTKEAH